MQSAFAAGSGVPLKVAGTLDMLWLLQHLNLLQVQDIAVKAIESASLQRFIPGYNEKSGEPMKQ